MRPPSPHPPVASLERALGGEPRRSNSSSHHSSAWSSVTNCRARPEARVPEAKTFAKDEPRRTPKTLPTLGWLARSGAVATGSSKSRAANAAGRAQLPVQVLIETHGALADAGKIAALPQVQSLSFGVHDIGSCT